MTKPQPLRKPLNSVVTTRIQYTEINEIWRDSRERVLALKREDYMTKGKAIARELQICMQKNRRDVNKIVHIVYERAVKDLHGYPIAALLFEDLGNEAENSFGGEGILDELQKQIQLGLSALKAKLGQLEKLSGTDVGIIFLLFLLLKMENLRKGDGSFFKNLLIKLFKEFHLYISANKWWQTEFSSIVLSAVCVLMHIAKDEARDSNIGYKLKQMLTILRNFVVRCDLKGTGKVQVLWTIELLTCEKSRSGTDEFYKQKYISACRKSIYLIDSLDVILSDPPSDATANDFERDDNFTTHEYAGDDLPNSSDNSDVFLDDGSNIASQEDTNKLTTNESHEEPSSKAASITQNDSRGFNHCSVSQDQNVSPSQEEANVKEIRAPTPKRSLNESASSFEMTRLIEAGTNEVSEEQTEVTEVIKVPDECMERIIGYQGAILRKLEYESQAKIELDLERFEGADDLRPETSSLTAQRLVAGALGVHTKIDKEQRENEKERLRAAKEIKVRYQSTFKNHEVKIIGSADAVSSAKRLINEIVNFTTFLDVPLPGLRIDDVIDMSGTKLKTIETLLNVILKLEELEDRSVVLHISGDKKSCEDAKKLCLEDLGRVYVMPGQLMLLPLSLKPFVESKESLDLFVKKLIDLSCINIRVLTNDKGIKYLFFTGNADRVYKAHGVMNKINTKLLFKDSTSDGDEDDKISSIDDVLEFMDSIHNESRSVSRQVSQDPTMVVKRKTYSRDFLAHFSCMPISRILPASLKQIVDGDDKDLKHIIVKEGLDHQELFSLIGSEYKTIPSRLSSS